MSKRYGHAAMCEPRVPLYSLLFFWLLAACAAPQTLMHSWEETGSSTGCDSPTEDGCVVLGCEDGLCGFFSCEDVLTEQLSTEDSSPLVEPALALRPGFPVGPARPGRWWRRAPWLRGGAEPVMTFRWYPERPPPPPPRALPAPAMEKHHLFPQAKDLAPWFAARGIKIHEYTMPIPVRRHWRIHGPGPNGGMWNEAWRQFINGPGRNASREEIYRHVGVLIYRFELTGPVVPYYRQFR